MEMFRIDRSGLVQEIVTAIETRSVLLAGSPGIGKSWLITAVARRLRESSRLLVLAAENYPVNSLEELQKTLGFKNDLLSVLSGLGERSFLIVDGLDALRTEQSQKVFRRLIKAVGTQVPSCRVLASIRTFDLQQSDELRNLFTDQAFERIHVRPLSAAELVQACEQEPRLTAFLMHADDAIRELLTNPYMLHLAIQLLRDGIAEQDLLGASSEVELLTKYWNRRVEAMTDGQLRKILLRNVVSHMTADRQLSISSATLDTLMLSQNAGSAFYGLKSDEILREGLTNRISFEHNILFDYTAARLLFDESTVIDALFADPVRAIFLRPSISYFFQYLWRHANTEFWTTAFQLFDPSTKHGERAAILPAVTIFESARSTAELSPLLDRKGAEAVRGIHNVLRAVQTFHAFTPRRRHLWLDFMEALSTQPSIVYINEYITALSLAFQTPGLSDEERGQIGRISRNLLLWGWEYAEALDHQSAMSLAGALSSRVLPVVIALFNTHPSNTRKIVEILFTRLGNPKADSHEAFRLVQEIRSIIDTDPKFAHRVYVALFTYSETSTDTTQLGSGSVMRMTSNRAQDFHTAVYGLQQSFDAFLTRSRLWAARAAIDAVNAEIPRLHPRSSPIDQFTFQFLGAPTTYTIDYSEIWDKGYSQNESLTLFNHVARKVLTTADGRRANTNDVRMLLREVGRRNTLAVTWKRIFETREKDYPRVAKYLLPVLTNPQFLSAPEVVVACGDTLSEAYAANVLNTAQKKAVETAILAIPSAKIILRYERPDALRNRLLTRIPVQSLVTDEAKQIVAELGKRAEDSSNKPYHRSSVTTHRITDEDWLRERGAKVEDANVQRLLTAYRPLQTFQTRYSNEAPPVPEALALEPAVREVASLLEDEKLDKIAATEAEGVLAGALETMVKNPDLPSDSSLWATARELILTLSAHPSPEADPEDAKSFDKPGWGSPLPRIEAAQGVMYLIWNWGFDRQLKEAAFRLAEDLVPAVRFQVAANVNGFYRHDVTVFWALVDKIIDTEATAGVMSGVVSQLARMSGSDPEKVVVRLGTIVKRGFSTNDNDYILTPLAQALVGLAVYRGTESARQQIEVFHKDPRTYASVLGKIIFILNGEILEGRDETITDDVRSRAIAIQQNIISDLNRTLDGVLSSQNFNADEYQNILHLTDGIIFRIYIGLDVDPDLRNQRPALSEEERKIYFFQYRPMLEALLLSRTDGRAHLTSSGAYNLMKLFVSILDYDPEQILQWASKTCEAAAHLGYQYDSMAIGETVRLVELVLADHHELLRKSDNARAVSEMLDIFVQAGWAAAVQLVMRLDEALR